MATPTKRSRKHMLAQQSPKAEAISQRLTVRIPKKLHKLMTEAVESSNPKISRNKWVSDSIIRLRERHVLSRLELPILDTEGKPDMTADERKAVISVNNGLAILVSDTKLFSGESVSLPIRFTEQGVDALQDLISRVRAHQRFVESPERETLGYKADELSDVDDKVFEKIKTIFVHIALWGKVMDGKTMEDLNEARL
ncbi:MAG: hypothetical protein GY833_22355 [Aestuariibacter sp.]|nr:hypothetical protein [Aestuariibacter sp.]|tara:strand:- start:1702 stop:2292 length:591 start_codon:yes stop_codon:yes gene_type:complete